MAEEWLSITEAAKLVSYHRDTIRDLAKAGTIKSRKIVTVWQVSKSSLLSYIRQREKHGGKRGPKKIVDNR